MKEYAGKYSEMLHKIINLEEPMSDEEFKVLSEYARSYARLEVNFLNEATKKERRNLLREMEMAIIIRQEDQILNDPDTLDEFFDSYTHKEQKAVLNYIWSVSKAFLEAYKVVKMQQALIDKQMEKIEELKDPTDKMILEREKDVNQKEEEEQ